MIEQQKVNGGDVRKKNLLTKEMIIMNRRLYLEYYDEDLSRGLVREISTGSVGIIDGAKSMDDGLVNNYFVKFKHQSNEDSSLKWLDIYHLELLN